MQCYKKGTEKAQAPLEWSECVERVSNSNLVLHVSRLTRRLKDRTKSILFEKSPDINSGSLSWKHSFLSYGTQ